MFFLHDVNDHCVGNAQAYLDGSRLNAKTIDSYVELHIEQGPLLEADNKDVGIVTHIFGPSLTNERLSILRPWTACDRAE